MRSHTRLTYASEQQEGNPRFNRMHTHAGKPVAPLVEAQPQMPRAGPRPAAFEVPSKRIGSEEDLKHFLEGETAKDFVAFILSLNQAVTGG